MVAAMESELQLVLPDPKAANVLKEPLGPKVEKLKAVKENADYAKLPAELRKRVDDYLAEIKAYQDFEKKLNAGVPAPSEADRNQVLDDIEQALNDMPLPPAYAERWQDTRLGKRLRQWQADIPQLRKAVADTVAWYKDRKKQGEELEAAGLKLILNKAPRPERVAWLDSCDDFMDKSAPFDKTARIARDSPITYDTVYHFDSVIEARSRLEAFRDGDLATTLKRVRSSLNAP
jgi:hypothetical protein